jgi:hypothetical protein
VVRQAGDVAALVMGAQVTCRPALPTGEASICSSRSSEPTGPTPRSCSRAWATFGAGVPVDAESLTALLPGLD